MRIFPYSVVRRFGAAALPLFAAVLPAIAVAQAAGPITVPTLHLAQPFLPLQHYGPYNAHILTGGRGLTKSLPSQDPILQASTPWMLSAWVKLSSVSPSTVWIAGAGDPSSEDYRFFALAEGKPVFQTGKSEQLVAGKPLSRQEWHLLSATFDGVLTRFYVDGLEQAQGELKTAAIEPQLMLAPVETSTTGPLPHFGGYIAGFTLDRTVLSADRMATLAQEKPVPDLIEFEEGSKPWPLQVVQYAGNTAPQEPWTMPKQNAPYSHPVVQPAPPATTTLVPDSPDNWTLSGGWKLGVASQISDSPAAIASPGFKTACWMAATVPGTVLTTMIRRGIFPDPYYGLNNLDIPEKLNRQSYWYRAEFKSPPLHGGVQEHLLLDGINYHAEVWFNGHDLGPMTGAFLRRSFDVTHLLHTEGENALAILISPPPHPGIPNVQSIALGAGLNGGAMELDGPTFLATEGWDWNPPMHDRDTGLWQDVHLLVSGPVSIGDPQVITRLPLPDTTQADITLDVPLENDSARSVTGMLTAQFGEVEIHRRVTVPPDGITVHLSPKEFPALHLLHPRLWWPNGYGKPNLYRLTTTFNTSGAPPTMKSLRFGVREITYGISLLDNHGALRRVLYDPTLGREDGEPQVDVTHAGMRQVPGGWAASITAGDDNSPAFQTVTDTRATPYLSILVNGVPIAIRGGSWGMDDSRKRVSRARLEPFFRYERDAHLNIIRNWQGQNTEETFYELADEYGMLVWNDFWEVTGDSNAEAEDPQLFLSNARDTILRFRNHPSIVMWCGRNEGVPQPIINQGLIQLTHTLDGTRYYSPSSNQVNLLPSGPYSYEPPEDYYSTLDRGFAVEVGIPSLPTLEWFSRWLPDADRWPISDDWAYHNWHPYSSFTRTMEKQFGVANSLRQYVREAQMMNYVDFRALFEGFNANLWSPNTGRLLWMTQPSWPSMLWGILTSDYDTQASFYGTRKACEPIHVQLDPANNQVQVVDTTRHALDHVKVDANVYGLQGNMLLHREITLNAATDNVTPAMHLDIDPLMGDSTIFVKLWLYASNGSLLSQNFYWRAASDAGYRALNTLPAAPVMLSAHFAPGAEAPQEQRLEVLLKNQGTVPALNAKLGAFRQSDGAEILPAYYSDNYISLLPGEERTVTVDIPATDAKHGLSLKLRGWNVVKTSVALAP